MESTTSAFWSYTHEDDERLGGAITRLANRLGDEYAVSSGDDLNLFLDRQSLDWGDAWRQKIDAALGTAPLFIAIVTPKFVKSAECRRELLTFISQAESRGFSRLLLPILFIDVPGLHENNPDEVLAILARTQYVPWTRLRLLTEDSSEVRTAVNALALRIMQLQEEANESMSAVEKRAEEKESATLEEVFGAIRERMPAWADAVESDGMRHAQWNAAVVQAEKQAERARRTPGRAGSLLSVYTKLGVQLAPLAAMRLEDAQTYHRLTVELDPYIASAVRMISQKPWLSELLDEARGWISEAMLQIEVGKNYPVDITNPHHGTLTDVGYLVGNAWNEYGPNLRGAAAAIDEASQFISEANEVVTGWKRSLEALGEEQASPASSAVPDRTA